MKIPNINLYNNTNFKSGFKNNQKDTNQENNKQINNLINNVAYIPFTGGISIDLMQTHKQLPPRVYPNGIEENITQILETGNPEDKTLYDVHFNKYSDILKCNTLEELKDKYPEFKDVKSSFDVEAKEGSFLAKFQEDELEYFPVDEDLSLQLIKLYWGQGFSLNDLSEYIAKQEDDGKGINLYYAMTKKLNIPIMNLQYAKVLKLSNREYNEKFTNALSEKLKESREMRQQKRESEPVYIPRGPLSDEHKTRISEGLKRYYSENPEKALELSERQKQYYIDNPDKAEEFSQIMFYAWNNTKEGKGLLKNINKFMRQNKKPEINVDELSYKKDMSSEQRTLLQKFWERNKWARKELSKAMKLAYQNQSSRAEKIDYIQEFKKQGVIVVDLIPKAARRDIIRWAKEKGIDIEGYPISQLLISQNNEVNEAKQKFSKVIQPIMNEYSNTHIEESNACTSVLINTYSELINTVEYKRNNLPDKIKNNPTELNKLYFMLVRVGVRNGLYIRSQDGSYRPNMGEITIEQMNRVFQEIIAEIVQLGNLEFVEVMNQQINESYNNLVKAGRIKAFQPF